MGKNKMIAKSCPKCELQVAVASKSCKCGHTFFTARRGADHPPAEDMKRRTGRVRRSQPQFYDAQHYQKQVKKRSPKKRSLSRSNDEDYKGKDKESATARARRRRARLLAAAAARAAGALQPHPARDQPQDGRRHLATTLLDHQHIQKERKDSYCGRIKKITRDMTHITERNTVILPQTGFTYLPTSIRNQNNFIA